MAKRPAEAWSEVRAFLSEGMWRAELQPRTWTARGVALLQFASMVLERFVADQLLLRASALTYFTALSIVPLLALVSAVLTALGVTEDLVVRFASEVEGAFPGLGARLLELVEGVELGGLGTLGAAALFLTTLLGISNIERALNHIWGVTHQRPLVRRIPDYLAVLIVAPLLLGTALSLATTARSQWIVDRLLSTPGLESLVVLGFGQVPLLLLLLAAFAFLYWFLPNTSVRPFAALLGALVAAVGVQATLELYVALGVGVARADALYGGFAQVPLFFVFVYFFWAIVLIGAEIAFAYQNLEHHRREVRDERVGPAQREGVGLGIALEVARRFRDGTPPLSADALSDLLRVPVRTVRAVLAELERAGVLAALDASERELAYQLGRPAERIAVLDVLAALRGPREPGSGDPRVAGAVDAMLAEIGEGEAKAAGGRSLADLLADVPAADAVRGHRH